MNIGKAIKDIRKERKINQLSLSLKSGYSQTHISLIENGINVASPECIEAIANSIGCGSDYIYLKAIELNYISKSDKVNIIQDMLKSIIY